MMASPEGAVIPNLRYHIHTSVYIYGSSMPYTYYAPILACKKLAYYKQRVSL